MSVSARTYERIRAAAERATEAGDGTTRRKGRMVVTCTDIVKSACADILGAP
ncbi:MAG TPA: hypothetical protein VFD36_23040 [Kofleriaceae bacterium]|nr:hypothetical protein [Kofleriaceae bacterium]